jgi:hypothetical protein
MIIKYFDFTIRRKIRKKNRKSPSEATERDFHFTNSTKLFSGFTVSVFSNHFTPKIHFGLF